MTKDAVFLVGPENIEGDDILNDHVFDGYYDTTSNEWVYSSNLSRCGKVNGKKRTSSIVKDIDGKKFCHRLIEGHDEDFNVCGMCMASFFADGE